VGYPAAAVAIAYTANNLNQYTAIGSASPTYNGNGSLHFDGAYTYCYDFESRLTAILSAGTCAAPTTTVAAYAYDAQGRRKSRTIGAATTTYVTDAGNREVLDYNAAGAIQDWYAFALGPDAVLNRMGVASNTRATMIPDVIGSVAGALDAASGNLAKFGYQTFGENPSLAAGGFRNTARRFDPETAGSASQPSGLYYYRARTYSPAWGRFLQPDPSGYPAGANLYAYVNNDPLNLTDPFGLCDNPQGCGGGGSQVQREPGLTSPCIECLAIPALGLPRIVGFAYDVYQAYQALANAPPTAPDFVVSPNGTVYAVPAGAEGPTAVINPAGTQTGAAFTGGSGGANGQVSTMRLMNPTPPRGSSPGYPNGYIVYQNNQSPTPQIVNPLTGQTTSNALGHYPVQ
jgi:RHS repeat-associated protein